ncbi:hypothetical protein SAMN04488134_11333 [Amphibacillus marinus]|uniref:Uncharacterized protein n=1 Tax=Amphibacillus marinus TaxID=872970 RepID=A0A1H8SKW1_9BACI|nr:hypothetical protein [Amphibacillus marinus]SEO79599.1 hypothetical protein SAMN04488134_11333 [Amphibacillus marinus]
MYIDQLRKDYIKIQLDFIQSHKNKKKYYTLSALVLIVYFIIFELVRRYAAFLDGKAFSLLTFFIFALCLFIIKKIRTRLVLREFDRAELQKKFEALFMSQSLTLSQFQIVQSSIGQRLKEKRNKLLVVLAVLGVFAYPVWHRLLSLMIGEQDLWVNLDDSFTLMSLVFLAIVISYQLVMAVLDMLQSEYTTLLSLRQSLEDYLLMTNSAKDQHLSAR